MHRLPPETAAHVMQHLGQENIQALHRVSKKTHAAVLNAKPHLMVVAKELYARSSASPGVTQYIDSNEEMLAFIQKIVTSLNHLVQNQRDIQARLHHEFSHHEDATAAWENVLKPLFPPSARLMETRDNEDLGTVQYHFQYKITYGYVQVFMNFRNMLLNVAIVYNNSNGPANDIYVTPYIIVYKLIFNTRYDADAPISAENQLKNIYTYHSEIRVNIYSSTRITTLVQIARDVDALKSFYNKHGVVVNVIIADKYKKVLDMFK